MKNSEDLDIFKTMGKPIRIMNEYFENHRKSINNKLDELLPKSSQKVGNLFSAMRYSMLNGGKRIRPLLCIAAAGPTAAR